MPRRMGWAAALALLSVLFACARSRVPSAPEASLVTVEASLGNTFVKAGASQALVARIELSTPARSAALRPPVNVALLVDTSGSMDGRAIDDARAASLALLESLAPQDRLAVVVFHSKADVLLPSTKLEDADLGDLKKKIGAMKASGTTDMTAGLRMALDEVEGHFVKEGVNRVVLLGDGVPNDDASIASHVAEASARGISITTLGLGNDYDETLMGRMAQASGGKFSYVEDSTKVASFFKEEVVRLHRVVAKNAVVELRPGPGVVVENVIGRPTTRGDRSLLVSLGDVTLGERHELVVELAANPAKDGATLEALDAVVRWVDVSGTEHEERAFVGAKVTNDEARLAAGKNEAVAQAAARARDAAATLERIERDRASQRARDRAAPESADLAVPFKKGGAPAPARMPADEIRRQHSEAIQRFQAF